MSWWSGLPWRRRTKLSVDDPAGWDVGGTAAGRDVTPDSALRLATAWACVRLLSETVGTLPLPVYRRTATGRETASDHWLYRLVHDAPNADQTAAEFWEGQVASLCLRGNGYARKVRIGDRLVSLQPLQADRVTVYRDENGARRYRYSGRSSSEVLSEAEMFHLRGFGVGGDEGLSPISYARETLATAAGADEVAGKMFATGLQLAGFIEMTAGGGKLTKEQRKDLVELFSRFAGSSQAGKVMPLDPGMSFKALGMNPEDAQLLQTRAFHVEEICRWYRVPPFMIGHTEKTSSWGTGLEQQMIGFLTFSLRPYLVRIEQAVRQQLLPPAERAEIYAEFNVEGLLRADSAGRAALYASAADHGWMTRREIRRRENLPEREGDDVLTVQANLVPLDQLGGADPGQQARAALLSWLGQTEADHDSQSR